MAPTNQGRHDGCGCYSRCGPRPEGVEKKDKADLVDREKAIKVSKVSKIRPSPSWNILEPWVTYFGVCNRLMSSAALSTSASWEVSSLDPCCPSLVRQRMALGMRSCSLAPSCNKSCIHKTSSLPIPIL